MEDSVDGRYELHEVLASGGMATVWRARDTRLDRPVALKRPHPAPPGDPVHARLEREARAAASLNHPHLVTIYDVGRDEDGPFLVMEMVEGPTLAAAGQGMDPRRAVEIGAQIADALATVHAAGIVHRDVKPANVLMSSRGPQLTDFGIALEGDSSRLTRPGSVIATPSYASPEQLEGRPATARSDVFSLGVVLYELITGRLPLPGMDHTRPPEPIGDAGLDALFRRVLSPDPDERPDAAELSESLRASAPTVTFVPGGGSTMTMPAADAPRRDDPPRSDGNRVSPWSVGLAAFAVVAGLALLAFAASESRVPVGAATTAAPSPQPPSTSAQTSVTTVLATTSTSSPPPTTTPVSTTPVATSAPPRDGVGSARSQLEEALASAHPSDLNPNEVGEQMEKADDAIEAVEEGEEDEAGQKLREIAREIDDKLENGARHDSLEALVALADALDVSLDEDDD